MYSKECIIYLQKKSFVYTMDYDFFDKYTFICEMYNEDADEIRELALTFYPFDNSVQVVDIKRKKKLVRRSQLPSLTLAMLQIGNVVNIFGKLLLITDASGLTQRTLFKGNESTFALIKPIPPSQHGTVITFIMRNGFRITRMKNGKISKEFAMKLYNSISGSSLMPIIIDYITNGEVIGLELVAPDAVKKWRKCLGATNPTEAAPGTIRQMLGQSTLKNVAHGCNTLEDATEMLEEFFGYKNGIPRIPFQSTMKDCTCCIILPHAVIDNNLGPIIEAISSSDLFYVTAIAMFMVNLANAKEFYEVYKNVLPHYEAMSMHLAEGKCVAVEVKLQEPGPNIVCEFRKLCGPKDPEVARQLYPETIRAKYGKSIVHNAVHCTDLPEDGETEVEYFFKLLGNI